MVEGMKERGDEGEGTEGEESQRIEDHPHPESQQDDTDILNGVVRQQRLDIVFVQGVEHADE